MKGVCLIVWMFISLLLVCSIVGLLLFIPKDIWGNSDNTRSTWASIGISLLDNFKK